MDLRQTAQGRVQLWVDGKIWYSVMPDTNYRVIDEDKIHLINAKSQLGYIEIKASEIENVEIAGGGLTPQTFISSQQLAEFLDNNFFFELSGASNVFSRFGATEEYTQTQSAGVGLVNSHTLLVGRQHFFALWLSGWRTEFTFVKLASGSGGNFNFAIYKGPNSGPYIPTAKVWQSPEFALTTAQELAQATISPAVYFSPGWYFCAYQADQGFVFTGTPTNLTFLGLDISGVPAVSIIHRLVANLGYSSSFPDTWVAGLANSLTGTPPLLLQKTT